MCENENGQCQLKLPFRVASTLEISFVRRRETSLTTSICGSNSVAVRPSKNLRDDSHEN